MYKSAPVKVTRGTFCHAAESADGTEIYTREGSRIVRRKMIGGRVFGARVCSYADAYFAYPNEGLTAEILGEEILYGNTTGTNS